MDYWGEIEMKVNYLQILYQELLKYSEIPIEEFEKFKSITEIYHLEKGQFFLQAGEKPDKFGFVVAGVLRLFYTTIEGNEYNKSFCVEGDFVASYSALLQNKESKLSINVLEKATLIIAHYNDYLKLTNQHLCWQILSRKLAEDLFIKKEQKESQFLLDSAEERYYNFLQEYSNLESRIKQYHVASYLGITPVALSRIRAGMKNY